ncbi:glycosyltransferase [Martelella alba]|uniref:Glycosyltransferase n=1 Tax=Martelella alba TaxID=2590451 RepID=A0A506UBI9_9HYPH|nr:glycosyltransferase [Martelella alba]TPW30009.1 glycosyltransferase [Martelella alba]
MTIAALSITVLLTGLYLATAVLTAWRYRLRKAVRVNEHPSITVMRPVCGLDPSDVETLESTFLLDYPDYDIIFCAARADDPACAALRTMMARFPERPARLLIGDDRETGNPKLDNLLKGWPEAGGRFVAMVDANLLLPPDFLETLLLAWTPDCALVSSPAAGTRPENLWGSLECAFLNGHQARWQLSADSLGLGFAQGKTLFVEKAFLDRAGGLVALGSDLAEDVAFTKLVRADDKKVRLAPHAFAQPIGRRRFQAVWDRQIRWSRVRRAGFVGLFVLELAMGFLPPLIALLFVAPVFWGIPFVIGWFAVEVALARLAGWPAGPRDIAAMVLRDLLLPVIWFATWARRGFEWRGNAMGLADDPA